jgi:hypothetical protein
MIGIDTIALHLSLDGMQLTNMKNYEITPVILITAIAVEELLHLGASTNDGRESCTGPPTSADRICSILFAAIQFLARYSLAVTCRFGLMMNVFAMTTLLEGGMGYQRVFHR